MCDAFKTGACPSRIFVTSNVLCLRQLQHQLRNCFILFETISFSETDKGILLFSTQDRDECDAIFKINASQANNFGNCFHEYVLNVNLTSSACKPKRRECDSTS